MSGTASWACRSMQGWSSWSCFMEWIGYSSFLEGLNGNALTLHAGEGRQSRGSGGRGGGEGNNRSIWQIQRCWINPLPFQLAAASDNVEASFSLLPSSRESMSFSSRGAKCLHKRLERPVSAVAFSITYFTLIIRSCIRYLDSLHYYTLQLCLNLLPIKHSPRLHSNNTYLYHKHQRIFHYCN